MRGSVLLKHSGFALRCLSVNTKVLIKLFSKVCGVQRQRLWSLSAESETPQRQELRRDQQRRGYAKEAAGAVLQWALQNTDYPAFYSYCKSTNTASVRTAEAIGMRFDREYPDAVNGVTHVSVIRRDA